jgi:hypothetical protein
MCHGRRLTRALLVSAAALSAAVADAATRFDPALRFRVLGTEHFRIYFHQNTDHLAVRLSVIAEETWRTLPQPLGVQPPRLTHVVLADQADLSNGYATPLPYDTIVIYTTAPPGLEFNADDWLRLVFVHEFTHVVHLDRSESWARVVRAVLGRSPIAFPNLFLPTWQIEGLAVLEESASPGEGRLHAGDFRAVVDEAARDLRLEPLDRVNGGLTDWPAGQAAYAYGAAFHQYLAERFGAEKLGELAYRTARRVPYTAAPAFSKVFGESLGDLWRDFEKAAANSAAHVEGNSAAVRLTTNGFVASGPRFEAKACPDCGDGIVYAARTPDAFPSLNRVGPAGGTTTIAERYFGSTTAVGRDAVYFDQLEVTRNVALTGDLYVWSRRTRNTTRLTSGARLHDPDLSPDGTRLVAVQEHDGQRDLVILSKLSGDKPAIDVIAAAAETQFNAPRWSPDGRSVAVERHRSRRDSELVVVNVESHAVRVAASPPGVRIVTPTWRPDGRAVLAAVAKGDEPFNVYEFPTDGSAIMRQLTSTTGGATWPEVSPDGKTLVYVGYSTAGFDLYSMPMPETAAAVDTPAGDRGGNGDQSSSVQAASALSGTIATGYSPRRTLLPTSWSPEVVWDDNQVRLGASTFGIDVLGYHAWAASATWLASAPAGAPTPDRGVPDWSLSYAYDRWRPTLVLAGSAETSFFAGPATPAGTPSAATDRQLQLESGVIVPFVRVRHQHQVLGTYFRARDEYTLPGDRQTSVDRGSVRAAWRSNTARTYGYSISPEAGLTAGATVEFVRPGLGADASATTATADVRAFLPGFRRHDVIAGRAAGGASNGDRRVGRTFLLGGSSPDESVIDFGSSGMSLLRGFPADSFAGSHVALANVEYRFALARPQRGDGTWPIFLHTLHAAGLIDVGHAWTNTFDTAAIKTSFGVELSGNFVAGFYYPFRATVGVAHGHDGSGIRRDGTVVYFRIGRSF